LRGEEGRRSARFIQGQAGLFRKAAYAWRKVSFSEGQSGNGRGRAGGRLTRKNRQSGPGVLDLPSWAFEGEKEASSSTSVEAEAEEDQPKGERTRAERGRGRRRWKSDKDGYLCSRRSVRLGGRRARGDGGGS